MQEFWFFLQLVIQGLAVGSVYALVALGFVLIYKASSVINFAQGELLMVGAYVCLAMLTTFQVPFWAAFILIDIIRSRGWFTVTRILEMG